MTNIFYPISWPFPTSQQRIEVAEKCLITASFFNDPICKARESFCRISIIDEKLSVMEKNIQKVNLLFQSALFGMIAIFTTPIAAFLRAVSYQISPTNFLYFDKAKSENSFNKKSFTIYLQNVCCMPAGYSITDGGILPPSEKSRLDAIISQIKTNNPDLICLLEVEDICDANYFNEKLEEYPYQIPVAGIRTIGPSSMIYIASKYKIEKNSIQFIPFIKGDELTGRAQFSEKGILMFHFASQNESKITILATHLQHSEIPQFPEGFEQESRKKQIKKIEEIVQGEIQKSHRIVLMGDLNQEEIELEKNLNFSEWKRDESIKNMPTWGGDQWCASLENKKESEPLVLDYTLVSKSLDITTQIIPCSFDGTTFSDQALSDHKALLSTVFLKQKND